MTAVADGNGNIVNDQFSPDIYDVNVRFYLTAVGSQSGWQAQNTFTDAPAVKKYEASIAPTSDTAGHASSGYTLTITNDPTSTNTLGSASFTVPSGYSLVVLGTVTTSGGESWSASISGGAITLNAVTGNQKLAAGHSVSLSLAATAPCTAAAYIWTSAAGSATPFSPPGDFALSDSQPSVQITGSCDSTPPVITPNTSGTLGTNGWYISDVTVSWTVSDPESTVSSTSGCSSTTISADTTGTTLTCQATSAGGTSSQSVTIKRDATRPTATASSSPAPNGNGWNNTDVTVTFAGSDSLSGIDFCTTATTLSADGAGQSASGTCTDKAGNVSPAATASGINIDKTGPVITFVSRTPANVNGWNNGDVTVNWSCADPLSGPVAASVSHTLSTEGAGQSSTGTCEDKAGNTASDTQSNINIDKTAPTITASRAPAANSNGWNSTDVLASYNASDSLSGLDSAATGNFNFTSEGSGQSHTFTVTDKAGNSASFTISDVNIDKTPPSATATPSPAANANGWNNTNVTVSFSGADSLSGIDSCVAPIILSAEGAGQSASGTCTDKAGNVSLTATASGINIDKTRPVITFASRTPAVNGWNNGDVTVNWSCADPLSGAVAASVSHTLSGEGAGQSSLGTCEDKAGNTASDTQSNINIDKTPQTITAIRAPVANGYGWNNTDVLASYTANDSLSGLESADTGIFNFASEGAGQSHIFTVVDKAGNSASFTISDVNIDKTRPSATATPSPAANANGWNNTNVTVSFTGTDSLSGIVSCAPDAILNAEGAGQSASGSCTDKAGNVSLTATASAINIDKTPPTVNVTGVADLATYTLGAVPVAGCNTTDSLSGVASSATVAVTGGVPPGVGTFSAACSGATDKAGNSSSKTVTYKVQYAIGGTCLGDLGHTILQPINADGSSVFNGKSTSPAKFRVCDANGTSVGTAGVVSNFSIYQIVAGTIPSPVDEDVFSTTPDTVFRWDPIGLQWIFNINNKSYLSNRTYFFRISLNDGTTILFQYGLK